MSQDQKSAEILVPETSKKQQRGTICDPPGKGDYDMANGVRVDREYSNTLHSVCSDKNKRKKYFEKKQQKTKCKKRKENRTYRYHSDSTRSKIKKSETCQISLVQKLMSDNHLDERYG